MPSEAMAVVAAANETIACSSGRSKNRSIKGLAALINKEVVRPNAVFSQNAVLRAKVKT